MLTAFVACSSAMDVGFPTSSSQIRHSPKSKGFGRRQAYVNPDMYDPRIVERGAMGISASGRPSAGYAVVSVADIWSPPAQHNGDWTCLRRVVERETVVVVQ